MELYVSTGFQTISPKEQNPQPVVKRLLSFLGISSLDKLSHHIDIPTDKIPGLFYLEQENII